MTLKQALNAERFIKNWKLKRDKKNSGPIKRNSLAFAVQYLANRQQFNLNLI